MDKDIRLSGIAYESLVNGPGIRRVFFSQGCKHNCKGLSIEIDINKILNKR